MDQQDERTMTLPGKKTCLLLLITCMALPLGCEKGDKAAPPVTTIPVVRLVQPEKRVILRTVGQPGFVEAYEQTSLFPKISGYIEKWDVDIGDKVKKDQVLATLFVPELIEEHKQKKATVDLDIVRVSQSQKLVEVADSVLKAAVSKVELATADVGKYQAEVERWSSEVKRLTDLVTQRVVDKQILDESLKQLRSSEASRNASRAGVKVADADRLAQSANLDKSRIDVLEAEARVRVSQADEKRLAALVGYTKITAPYEGIVIARNANTGDFAQGTTGDQSAPGKSSDQSSSRGAPIYVVARTDVVRVFVDIPEIDANFVRQGTKATVRVQAFRDFEIPAEVTRTAWALNVKSRTLRAEVDLNNPDAKLLPGMYAYGYVKIERPSFITLPTRVIGEKGDQSICYLYRDGKAVLTPLRVGASDGAYQVVSARLEGSEWVPLTEKDSVILVDLSELADGIAVQVEK